MRARRAAVLARPLEEDEQRLYFQWVALVRIQKRVSQLGEPWLALRPHCHAVPNQRGSRTAVNNMILKAQGVTAGVSDISVLVPSGAAHGLFLELKRQGMDWRDATDAQLEQIDARRRMGYVASVVAGFDAARGVTLDYLEHSWRVLDPYPPMERAPR